MRLGTVPFLKAVDDVTGGNIKIQRKDYQQAGILPVIDQGQEEVAGYTDNIEAAFQGSLPVILFGDHTRIFKYVDKPFALGAGQDSCSQRWFRCQVYLLLLVIVRHPQSRVQSALQILK